MNIRNLIIFLTLSSSPGKIDFASILYACKRNLEKKILIFFLTLTIYQTNSLISTLTFINYAKNKIK